MLTKHKLCIEAIDKWQNGTWYERLALRRWNQGRVRFINGRNDDELYLARFYVIGSRYSKFQMFLHRFARGDDDQALHSHPFSFVSIPLAGKFLEQCRHEAHKRRPGSIYFRGMHSFHRVEIDPDYAERQPVWTLVMTFPRMHSWHFTPFRSRSVTWWQTYLRKSRRNLSVEL